MCSSSIFLLPHPPLSSSSALARAGGGRLGRLHSGGLGVGGVSRGRATLIAAGGQGQGEKQRQRQGKKFLFHLIRLLN